MSRGRRIVIAVLVAIPVALALAIVALTLLVDPNAYRGEIERRVSAAAGMPFRLQGDIRIAWFPWLALTTEAAALGGDGAAPGHRPIVAWQGARFGVKLVPLLRGEVQVDRVRLEKPAIWLHRASDGRGNWQALGGSGTSTSDAGGASPLDTLSIAGIEIRDGTLDFADDTDGSRYRLESWSLDAGPWRAGAEVPIETRFVARVGAGAGTGANARAAAGAESPRPLTARLAFKGRVRLDRAMTRVDAAAVHLDGDVTGLLAAAEGKSAPPTIPVRLDTDALAVVLEPLQVEATAWQAEVAGAHLAGSLALRSVAAAAAAGSARPADDAWRGAGRLEASADSLRAVLERLDLAPTPRTDPKTLGRFRLAADWKLDAGAVTLAPFSMELDDTRMQGTLGSLPAADPAAAREWRFDLQGDAIDLDRYAESPEVKGKPFELPVDTLKALRANGELRLRQARASGAELRGVKLRFETAEPAR